MIRSMIDSWFKELSFISVCVFIISILILGIIIILDNKLDVANKLKINAYEMINQNEIMINSLNRKTQGMGEEITRIRKLNKELLEIEKKYNELRIKKIAITAFSLTKNQCDDDPTIGAIGKVIPGYHAAVSRDLIYMLNKKVYIEGYGVFEIIDVMNKRFTSRIDLCMANTKLCRKFGIKKNIKVVLLN